MYTKPWQGMHFDAGGIEFKSNLYYDGNNQTFVAIIQPECPGLQGNFFVAQQTVAMVSDGGTSRIWIPPNNTTPIIGTTVYDLNEGWKACSVPYTQYDIFLVAQKVSNNECYVYTAKDGMMLNKCSFSVSKLRTLTGYNMIVGCWYDGSRIFHGTIYSVLLWKIGLDETELISLSNCGLCFKESKLPYYDDLIFGCIFDRLKYGDTPYDFVNDVYATKLNISTASPKWRLMLPKDVGMI